ncbi:MAG: hypothetical protein ABIP48_02150 [Planctomycetota bacterium]
MAVENLLQARFGLPSGDRMAISKELAAFPNEEALTNNFLLPLLRRLGFTIVVNYHGKREFGKDLVFGEIDRFHHVRYHGLQAKHVASVGKESVHGLIQDCDEAFAKDFTHRQTGQDHKIGSFYAVNGGSISDEARDFFFASLRPKHGDNIRLLSGSDLVALDRSATISCVESWREFLVGLLIEMKYNDRVLQSVIPLLQGIVQGDGHGVQYPPFRLRTNATESYLRRPFMPNDLPVEVVERFWAVGTAFNRELDKAGASPLHTVVSIKIPAANALEITSQLSQDAATLTQAINRTLLALGPLAAM